MSRAIPSAMFSASQRLRSCSAIGINSPSGPVRASRRASVSTISASSPATSESPGKTVQDAGQPDGLGGEVPALQVRSRRAGVALVEDQVQHVQHRVEPLRPFGVRWHAERQAAVLDALFGAADAAGHGRLRDQEGPGDLRGGQAADGPQGQRDLRCGRQRGVAAQEQQDERVVGRRVRAAVAEHCDPPPSHGRAGVQVAAVSSRRRRACSLRSRSVSRRDATVMSQPRGLSGMPSVGHWVAAASSASCTASSAVSKCP